MMNIATIIFGGDNIAAAAATTPTVINSIAASGGAPGTLIIRMQPFSYEIARFI
jgi:hypothetical protein